RSDAVEEKGVESRAVATRKSGEDRLEPRDIGGIEVRGGAHSSKQDRNLATFELTQDRIQIFLGQVRVEPAQHIIGAKLEDDQVGLAIEAVERPAEPGLAGFAGVTRNAAVDHL